MIQYALAVISTSVLGVYVIFLFVRLRDAQKESERIKSRGRTLSFGSSCMMRDPFPPVSKVLPPVINILLFFDACPSEESIVKGIMSLLKFKRLNSKVSFDNNEKVWHLESTEMDVKNHLSTVFADTEEEVVNVAHKLSLTEHLNYGEMPSWKFIRIINRGNGSSGILFRIHHVVGDGISLVRIMEKIFTDAKGKPFVMTLPQLSNTPKLGNLALFSFSLQVIYCFFKSLSLGLSPFDSNVPFNSTKKSSLTMAPSPQLVLFPTLKLDYLKEIKEKLAAVQKTNYTINDLLLSLMTGCIKRYCEHMKSKDISSRTTPSSPAGAQWHIRALLPLALPREQDAESLHETGLRNKWVFLSVPLPIAETDSRSRLVKSALVMKNLKNSPMAYVQHWVQNNIAANLPLFLRRQTLQDVFSRHSLVFSNVPGPQEPAYLDGKKLKGLQVLFPNLLSQCCIFSYNGGIFTNLVLDPDVVKEAHTLPGFFMEELMELSNILGVSVAEGDMLAPLSAGGFLRLPS